MNAQADRPVHSGQLIQPRSVWKELLVIGFVSIYLASAVVAALPRPATRWPALNRILKFTEFQLKPISWSLLHPLGLSQNWEMFSTIDQYRDNYFVVELKEASGAVGAVVPLVDLRSDEWLMKLFDARGLFFMETLSGRPDPVIFSDLATWALNRVTGPVRSRILRAEIVQKWRPTLLYGDHGKLPFYSYVLQDVALNLQGLTP